MLNLIHQRLQYYNDAAAYLRVALNALSTLVAGTIIGAALAFATQLTLARCLGPDQFGSFAAALATVTLVAPLAGFGIGGYWLKAFGQEGWKALRWLPGSYLFLVYSTVSVICVLLTWAWTGPHDQGMSWLLSILAVHVLASTAIDLSISRFQLEASYRRLAALQIAPNLLRFAGVILLILIIGAEAMSARDVSIVYAGVATIFMLTGAWQLRGMTPQRLKLAGHGPAPTPEVSKEVLCPGTTSIAAAAWPFGFAGLFYIVYFQSDIIILKYFVNEAVAGHYHVAFVVIGAIYILPGVMFQKFLIPHMHRWAYHDVKTLKDVFLAGSIGMLVLGILAMLAVFLLAELIILQLLGDEYNQAVQLLSILAFAIPFRFVATCAGAVLMTENYMFLKIRIMGVAALLNVVLNVVLILVYGPVGAAVATILTEVFIMFSYLICIKKVRFQDMLGIQQSLLS